jgi:TetR/AcrR family transcriptional regulator, fatty acid metabolism regulator protein
LNNNQRSLKEKQRQERENLILQVAEDVLLEKGYRDTSMDEIASRVGIAKGTLYLHFAKKEDLMFAFFERELQEVLRVIEETVALNMSAQEKLKAIIQAMYKDSQGRRAHFLYILSNSEDFKTRLHERPDHILKRIRDAVAAVLDEGKAQNEFDVTLPTDIMVDTFFCVLSPRARSRLMIDTHLSSQEVLRAVRRIYFRGIGSNLFED